MKGDTLAIPLRGTPELASLSLSALSPFRGDREQGQSEGRRRSGLSTGSSGGCWIWKRISVRNHIETQVDRGPTERERVNPPPAATPSGAVTAGSPVRPSQGSPTRGEAPKALPFPTKGGGAKSPPLSKGRFRGVRGEGLLRNTVKVRKSEAGAMQST